MRANIEKNQNACLWISKEVYAYIHDVPENKISQTAAGLPHQEQALGQSLLAQNGLRLLP
jgi:hypothetical protein